MWARVGILDGVNRLHRGQARAHVLPVGVLRVGLLDIGAVDEHDLHQPGGEPGGPDLAGKALAHQQGNPAGVVDMGVGDQDIVDGFRFKGQVLIANVVPALLQAAVDQNALSVDLQAVAAAGNALVRAEKAEFHGRSLLIL